MSLPDRTLACSAAWDALPAWGTATQASFWVALEQPGPWGRDALVQSELDPEVGARLGSAASEAGGRLLLIRSPGEHVDRLGFQSRRVYVAGSLAGSPWLLSGAVLRPDDLDQLPWDRLATASADDVMASCPWLHLHEDPVLLVCANSKRDVCCARLGRPVALAMAVRRPGQVWECSHTGGHRFAPTGIVLPLGQMLARLDVGLAEQVLDAAASGRFALGTLSERHDRGASQLAPAEAAALSWVRATIGETEPTALVSLGEADGVVDVQHLDGRTWRLAVTRSEHESRPESCGKAAVPSLTWSVAPMMA